MFGTREIFAYFECQACGCLQLINPPQDMSPYYPPNRYYSSNVALPEITVKKGFRRYSFNRRNEAQVFAYKNGWGQIAKRRPAGEVAALMPTLSFMQEYTLLRQMGYNAAILDVGCGKGVFLYQLASIGFQNLEGVDPFAKNIVDSKLNIRIRAMHLEELGAEKYDLITMHHSLEHVPDTSSALRAVKRLLRTGGVCKIEVPIMGCAAWQQYQTNWFDLDAPRHLYLHTAKSLEIAATEAGLLIKHKDYSNIPFTFYGSEMYSRDISLYEEGADRPRDLTTIFTAEEIGALDALSTKANSSGRGGFGVFILQRAS